MVTADRYQQAQAHVNDVLKKAGARYIEKGVPKLNGGQRRYIAHSLAANPRTLDAAIAKFGAVSVDEFLKSESGTNP